MYYCAAHQIAWENPRQFHSHWSFTHPGEPRPTTKDVFVEQAPEGTKIADPPKPRSAPGGQTPGPGSTPPGGQTPSLGSTPRVNAAALDGDDEGAHLDQLLIGIGVPPANREAIVTGFRSFSAVSQNPYNLTNFINTHVPPKLRSSVPLVIQEMFPGAEQEAPDVPYFYQGHGQVRPSPVYWPGQRPPPYQAPQEWGYFANGNPRPQGQSPEEDSRVVALQKQVEGILGELQTERAERAKEKQEQLEREREGAWQAQFKGLASEVDSSLKAVGDMVKDLATQIHQGRTEVETSDTQKLVEQVGNLTQTIASQRETQLQGTVDALRSELLQVSQKLNTEQTGKTTEDLAALGIPLAVAELRNMGNTVTTELKGIRTQVAEGKLLSLTPPTPGKPGAPDDPVKTAQQIAGARAVEDRILEMAGGQPRS